MKKYGSTPALLGRLIEGKKIRYVIVGVWNTIFAYSVFLALYAVAMHFKIHYTIVLVASQIVGLTNAYIFYKLLVFKTKGNVTTEYFRFFIIYGITFVINMILIVIFVEMMHFNPVISQGIIMFIVVILAYIGHNNLSFRPKRKNLIHLTGSQTKDA